MRRWEMAIREEELDLPVDEGEMAVFLYEPEDAGPLPSIIMVHDAVDGLAGLQVRQAEQADAVRLSHQVVI